MEKRILNLFIVVFLGAIIIDGIPSTFTFHRTLKPYVKNLVRPLGIDQGSWSLFAPSVDKGNNFFEAIIQYEDGSLRNWRSPNWSSMGPGEKFRHFRLSGYYNSIWREPNQEGWEDWAIWLAKEHQRNDLKVTSVEVLGTWVNIPGPNEKQEPAHHHRLFLKEFP